MAVVVLVTMPACGLLGGGEEAVADNSDASYFQSVPTSVPKSRGPAAPTPRPDEVFYDNDHNRLIEIANLDQLNAVRYDLNGDGIPSDELAYWEAFIGGRPGMGCPDGCIGYELTRDLDFTREASYQLGVLVTEWVEAVGGGWRPLGDDVEPYSAVFDGNGHTIKSLRLRHTRALPSGFFGVLSHTAEVRNFNLEALRVEGGSRTAGLVGDNHGLVVNCAVEGLVTGEIGVGGIVGVNRYTGVVRKSSYRGAVHGFDTVGGALGVNENGWVDSSYVEGTIKGRRHVGGLIGHNTQHGSAQIVFAYVRVLGAENLGALVGTNKGELRLAHTAGYIEAFHSYGGLVGVNELTGRISSSYSTVLIGPNPSTSPGGGAIGVQDGVADAVLWDTVASGTVEGVGVGSDAGIQGEVPQTLTRIVGYDGFLARWNVDIDGDGSADEPWEFGEPTDYPSLRADMDGDGKASAAEFGTQNKR